MPVLRRFTVDLAGLAVAFEAADEAWPAALAPRYGAFATRRAPRFVIRLTGAGEVRDAAALARLMAEPLAIVAAGSRLTLRSASVAAAVDLTTGQGELSAPVHRHGVDSLLRALLALTAPEALLLHGALAAEDGRAFVCAGPSGAGKSTLAALLGERGLCDELCLLRRGEEGWTAHALPFWHGRPGGGRLAGVRLLVHGPDHELRRLAPEAARRRLAAEVVWPTFAPEAAERALDLLARLLVEVPVAELRFRPDAGVWSALAGEVAA